MTCSYELSLKYASQHLPTVVCCAIPIRALSDKVSSFAGGHFSEGRLWTQAFHDRYCSTQNIGIRFTRTAYSCMMRFQPTSSFYLSVTFRTFVLALIQCDYHRSHVIPLARLASTVSNSIGVPSDTTTFTRLTCTLPTAFTAVFTSPAQHHNTMSLRININPPSTHCKQQGLAVGNPTGLETSTEPEH